MKNKILILCLLGFSLMACKEKKSQENMTDTELQESIQQVEQENESLIELENDIENDIKELDAILNEVDEK